MVRSSTTTGPQPKEKARETMDSNEKDDEIEKAAGRQPFIEIETVTQPGIEEEPVISKKKVEHTDLEAVPDAKQESKSTEDSRKNMEKSSKRPKAQKSKMKGEEYSEEESDWDDSIVEGEDFEMDELEKEKPTDSVSTKESTNQDESTEMESKSETEPETETDPETTEQETALETGTKTALGTGTTEKSAKQIPKPEPEPQASPTETTKDSKEKHLTVPTRKPKFIDGASCEVYTDDVCLEQQNDMGLKRRHQCCYKGIYLTEKCVPELCSKDTYNVCCFQKFIQVGTK